MTNKWQISEKLDQQQLLQQLQEITTMYSHRYVKHVKSGGLYVTGAAVTINIDGVTYQGIAYYPVCNSEVCYQITHTRPMHEFLDGRFEIMKAKVVDNATYSNPLHALLAHLEESREQLASLRLINKRLIIESLK